MNRRVIVALLLLGMTVAVAAESQWTVDTGWNTPLPLGALAAGTYQLDLSPGNVEPPLLLERLDPGKDWTAAGSITSDQPEQAATAEFVADDRTQWRVRPTAPLDEKRTLTLRSLSSPERTPPTENGTQAEEPRLIATSPPVAAATVVSAQLVDGQLWVSWLDQDLLRVWTPGPARPTPPWKVSGRVEELEIVPSPRLTLRVGGESDAEVTWDGKAWSSTPAPSPKTIEAFGGQLQWKGSPTHLILERQNHETDLSYRAAENTARIFVAAMDSQLWAAAVTKDGRCLSWSAWSGPTGWQALALPPWNQGTLQSLVGSREGVFALVTEGDQWSLAQYDGVRWRPPQSLNALSQKPLTAAALTPPSPECPQGLIVLASDRIRVYELP